MSQSAPRNSQNRYALPAVLTFSATDPSCGAGMQADLLTLSSMGCHALSVITAITVQDTAGVEAIHCFDADWVADQARCILEDVPIAAFKLGVMGSVENLQVIAEIVADYPHVPLVFDPVLASARGDEFSSQDMIAAMREMIIPQCTIITPNTPELRRLADEDDDDIAAIHMEILSKRLLEMGCEYVLVTGTHENTADVVNSLYGIGGRIRADSWKRLPHSYHGSGCTLASAVAATMARGLDIPDAVLEAQEYTWQTLRAGYRPGMAQFVPDRMFWARDDMDDEDGDNSSADVSNSANNAIESGLLGSI
jgi:hydroxymethylpyrimidine/phosphomethylpyrimidine kinase